MGTKPRVIITTDMECDDMNSMIHLCLHLNELDVDGIVYTSSRFHFNGDGVHTLGEACPNYRCIGEAAWLTHVGYPHPDPEARNLKSYRPFEEGWIESLWRNEYAEAYPFLVAHDPAFPTPERLLSITKVGNIAFEGDVRHETEGSNMIRDAILDADERPLYLLSWGGANTIVRALMSIHEMYGNTERWAEIQALVTRKVRILGIFDGVGQDNSYADHAKDLYPDMKLLRPDFAFPSFFSALHEQADCLHMFQADWLKKNIKFGYGPLMSKYGLFGDGTDYIGEAEVFQYGRQLQLNWGFDRVPNETYNPYDFLGEGDSTTFVPLIDLGLRGLEDGAYGTLLGRLYDCGEKPLPGTNWLKGEPGLANRFLRAFQEEFAARAEWCVKPYEQCNHAPVVAVAEKDICAVPGEVVRVEGSFSDPDGDALRSHWFIYREACRYAGQLTELRVWEPMQAVTRFTVPTDAQPGDFFNLVLEVQDAAEKPMTRYGQVIVHVGG